MNIEQRDHPVRCSYCLNSHLHCLHNDPTALDSFGITIINQLVNLLITIVKPAVTPSQWLLLSTRGQNETNEQKGGQQEEDGSENNPCDDHQHLYYLLDNNLFLDTTGQLIIDHLSFVDRISQMNQHVNCTANVDPLTTNQSTNSHQNIFMPSLFNDTASSINPFLQNTHSTDKSTRLHGQQQQQEQQQPTNNHQSNNNPYPRLSPHLSFNNLSRSHIPLNQFIQFTINRSFKTLLPATFPNTTRLLTESTIPLDILIKLTLNRVQFLLSIDLSRQDRSKNTIRIGIDGGSGVLSHFGPSLVEKIEDAKEVYFLMNQQKVASTTTTTTTTTTNVHIQPASSSSGEKDNDDMINNKLDLGPGSVNDKRTAQLPFYLPPSITTLESFYINQISYILTNDILGLLPSSERMITPNLLRKQSLSYDSNLYSTSDRHYDHINGYLNSMLYYLNEIIHQVMVVSVPQSSPSNTLDMIDCSIYNIDPISSNTTTSIDDDNIYDDNLTRYQYNELNHMTLEQLYKLKDYLILFVNITLTFSSPHSITTALNYHFLSNPSQSPLERSRYIIKDIVTGTGGEKSEIEMEDYRTLCSTNCYFCSKLLHSITTTFIKLVLDIINSLDVEINKFTTITIPMGKGLPITASPSHTDHSNNRDVVELPLFSIITKEQFYTTLFQSLTTTSFSLLTTLDTISMTFTMLFFQKLLAISSPSSTGSQSFRDLHGEGDGDYSGLGSTLAHFTHNFDRFLTLPPNSPHTQYNESFYATRQLFAEVKSNFEAIVQRSKNDNEHDSASWLRKVEYTLFQHRLIHSNHFKSSYLMSQQMSSQNDMVNVLDDNLEDGNNQWYQLFFLSNHHHNIKETSVGYLKSHRIILIQLNQWSKSLFKSYAELAFSEKCWSAPVFFFLNTKETFITQLLNEYNNKVSRNKTTTNNNNNYQSGFINRTKTGVALVQHHTIQKTEKQRQLERQRFKEDKQRKELIIKEIKQDEPPTDIGVDISFQLQQFALKKDREDGRIGLHGIHQGDQNYRKMIIDQENDKQQQQKQEDLASLPMKSTQMHDIDDIGCDDNIPSSQLRMIDSQETHRKDDNHNITDQTSNDSSIDPNLDLNLINYTSHDYRSQHILPIYFDSISPFDSKSQLSLLPNLSTNHTRDLISSSHSSIQSNNTTFQQNRPNYLLHLCPSTRTSFLPLFKSISHDTPQQSTLDLDAVQHYWVTHVLFHIAGCSICHITPFNPNEGIDARIKDSQSLTRNTIEVRLYHHLQFHIAKFLAKVHLPVPHLDLDPQSNRNSTNDNFFPNGIPKDGMVITLNTPEDPEVTINTAGNKTNNTTTTNTTGNTTTTKSFRLPPSLLQHAFFGNQKPRLYGSILQEKRFEEVTIKKEKLEELGKDDKFNFNRFLLKFKGYWAKYFRRNTIKTINMYLNQCSTIKIKMSSGPDIQHDASKLKRIYNFIRWGVFFHPLNQKSFVSPSSSSKQNDNQYKMSSPLIHPILLYLSHNESLSLLKWIITTSHNSNSFSQSSTGGHKTQQQYGSNLVATYQRIKSLIDTTKTMTGISFQFSHPDNSPQEADSAPYQPRKPRHLILLDPCGIYKPSKQTIQPITMSSTNDNKVQDPFADQQICSLVIPSLSYCFTNLPLSSSSTSLTIDPSSLSINYSNPKQLTSSNDLAKVQIYAFDYTSLDFSPQFIAKIRQNLLFYHGIALIHSSTLISLSLQRFQHSFDILLKALHNEFIIPIQAYDLNRITAPSTKKMQMEQRTFLIQFFRSVVNQLTVPMYDTIPLGYFNDNTHDEYYNIMKLVEYGDSINAHHHNNSNDNNSSQLPITNPFDVTYYVHTNLHKKVNLSFFNIINDLTKQHQIHPFSTTLHPFITLIHTQLSYILNKSPLYLLLSIIHTSSTSLSKTIAKLNQASDQSYQLTMASLIDYYAHVNFPPCMLYMYERMKKSRHLKHGARFQLRLFLKDIGLPLSEALAWWTRALPTMNRNELEYGIKHSYGKEGARKQYTLPSCPSLSSLVTNDIHHGCYFAHFQSTSSSKLTSEPKEGGGNVKFSEAEKGVGDGVTSNRNLHRFQHELVPIEDFLTHYSTSILRYRNGVTLPSLFTQQYRTNTQGSKNGNLTNQQQSSQPNTSRTLTQQFPLKPLNNYQIDEIAQMARNGRPIDACRLTLVQTHPILQTQLNPRKVPSSSRTSSFTKQSHNNSKKKPLTSTNPKQNGIDDYLDSTRDDHFSKKISGAEMMKDGDSNSNNDNSKNNINHHTNTLTSTQTSSYLPDNNPTQMIHNDDGLNATQFPSTQGIDNASQDQYSIQNDSQQGEKFSMTKPRLIEGFNLSQIQSPVDWYFTSRYYSDPTLHSYYFRHQGDDE